ncbi:MAG: Gfo/Idh/MocA family oxidoreductase [Acidobacteriaceae bacterium]
MTHPAEGEPVRVAVVGAGAFGRNHLRVYRELEQAGKPVVLAAVIEPNPDTRAAVESQFGIPGFASIADCMKSARQNLRRIHAASVCVPTVHHAATATELLACGIDLLIEKPLAATLDQADAILSAARQHRHIVQPGHLERFNPAVHAARSLVTRPMFFEVHRLSVFTPRSLDVDVVLDLMIHDLDVVMSLVRSPVREVRAVGLPVLSARVDIANVRIEFDNGCVANFTASRVSTERVRKLRFFQPHQYISLDFARQDLLMIDVAAAAGLDPAQLAAMATAAAMSSQGASAHPSAGLSLRKLPVTPGEPLRLEIESFLQAVRTRQQPEVTAEEGRAALALALEINEAIASHTARTGLS